MPTAMASFVAFTLLAIVVSLSNAVIISSGELLELLQENAALQESLVPNGDGSEVKMSYGDDDVIDMTGDLHEVADIKTLVGKPGLLDKVQETAGNGGAVVFSVQLFKTMHDPTVPTTVVFDHIATNDGDGYYPHTGIFTAPKAGYYSFSASLISDHSSRFFIMMNGQSVEYLVSLGKWAADAATVDLKLAKGDKVWIEGIGEMSGVPPDCYYTRRFGNRYKCHHSSFSGFLIKEI